MKIKTTQKRGGFTLIELLVVIAIIAVLAGMLLPVLGRSKVKADEATCRLEIKSIQTAITQYTADYNGRPPVSKEIRAALNLQSPDFTFGTSRVGTGGFNSGINGAGFPSLPAIQTLGVAGNVQRNNSDLVAILASIPTYRNGVNQGKDTVNANNKLNYNKNTYIDIRETKDFSSQGVGPDLVMRDPWGNPYIITIDLNADDNCRDAFYRNGTVSNGMPGLAGSGNNFEVRASSMVWSFGADGNANANLSAVEGANKDNITSWE